MHDKSTRSSVTIKLMGERQLDATPLQGLCRKALA
jgi:hypothetical protein